MKKPAIPGTGSLDPNLARILEPMKQNIEVITGARPGSTAINQLPATASVSDIIVTINQILSRINQSG